MDFSILLFRKPIFPWRLLIYHLNLLLTIICHVCIICHVSEYFLKYYLNILTFQNLIISALRSVIEKCSETSLPRFPLNNDRTNYGLVKVSRIASLFEVLDSLCNPMDIIESEQPISMESVGQVHIAICVNCWWNLVVDSFFLAIL